MKIIYELDKQHIDQLHDLYQKEWWTDKRTLFETQKVIDNSQIIIAIADENNELEAFVRVLTDYTFKALIFDLIVAKKQRNKGLGKELMKLISNHSELRSVKHFELYCLPKMKEFYEGLGFSSELENLVLMRKG